LASLNCLGGTVDFGDPWQYQLDISADSQLHNRADLLRELGLQTILNDSQLILAAYAKWGEECPNFLLGEFAFAIRDDRRKSLFCCRDHIGFRAFLYWRSGSRFVFAGDIEPILAHPGVPREVNRAKLAALAVPTAHHVRHEETFHSGIFSLPPGTSMTVTRDGIRQRRYWEPGPARGHAVPKRPEDVIEALRDLLFEAVACRLDSNNPVASLLSGGLDSSSIVAIAARCLEKQNRELTAISAVLPEESRAHFTDEREYIDEFRAWPNINIEYVSAPGRGPFDSLNDPSRFVAFPLRSSRFYLNEECEKKALAKGAQKLLWGFGGELGVSSWSERYYLELAIRGRWRTLFRELKRCRASRSASPSRMLAREVLNVLSPVRGWRPAVLLASDFRRQAKARPALRGRSPYLRRHQVSEIRFWLSKHAMERGQSISLIPPCSPLLDKRILEFCLAMPESMDVGDGYPRYRIRAALDGILPPRIQWRTTKAPYSPDYFVRYNAQLGIAREFVQAIRPNDPIRAIVDVEGLEKLLLPVDAAVGPTAARDEVPVSLYLINFLRQFPEFRL
jgi:asparagine synthase (glutamine-hydrolysing)